MGVIQGQKEKRVGYRADDKSGRMFFSVRLGYYLYHQKTIPADCARLTVHTPNTLLVGMVIVDGKEHKAWEVTEPPLPCVNKCGAWVWRQTRCYYPSSFPQDDDIGEKEIHLSGVREFTTVDPHYNDKAMRSRFLAIERQIHSVIATGEPQEWNGRIISPEWVKNNMKAPERDAPYFLTRLVMFGVRP